MILTLDHGTLDLERRVFVTAAGEVSLTTTEARLLAHLAAHPTRTFGRDELQVEVWGYRAGVPSRTVFTTVGRIRQKIEPDPTKPTVLLSVEGGYKFGAISAVRPTEPALPDPPTPFVGREGELGDLIALLRGGARLVSILGPGGIGKTRVAIECARRLGSEFDATFVPLDTVDSAAGLVRALVAALALRPASPTEDATTALVERMRAHRSLLVCDNVEQIVGAPAVFAKIAAACPGVRVLVTTRVRLSVSSETALAIAPLSEPRSADELEQSDAGRLALDHARRARPGWEPTPRDRAALVRLCGLAEGSPLAIELATAWLRLLDPIDVVRELEQKRDLLRTDRQDVPARHTSIRTTLESSFRLLAAETIRALGALAVVRAPFSRDAALAVASAGLRELGQAVDASMIRRTSEGRFAFHPAVREEALDRLEPEERRVAETRHAAFFLERLATTYVEHEASERAWIDGLSPDHVDLVAAFHHAARTGESALVARAAEPFYRYLDGRNRFAELAEAWHVAKASLSELPSAPPRDRALGLLLALEPGAGWSSTRGTPFVAMLEPHGGDDLAVGLVGASIACQLEGRFDDAKRFGERAVELAARSGRSWLVGFSHAVCASSLARTGELDRAASMLEHAVGLASSRGGRRLCRPLVHLGEVRLLMGQVDVAHDVLHRAVSACRGADDRSFALLALGRLGQARELRGEDPTGPFIEAIEEGCAHHIPAYWWSAALVGLSAIRANHADTAGPAVAALSALEVASRPGPTDRERIDAARAAADRAIGADAAHGWAESGATLGLEETALSLIAC